MLQCELSSSKVRFYHGRVCRRFLVNFLLLLGQMIEFISLSLFSYLQQGKPKGAKNKINLRRSPFYLQDGDIIGVKVVTLQTLPSIFLLIFLLT